MLRAARAAEPARRTRQFAPRLQATLCAAFLPSLYNLRMSVLTCLASLLFPGRSCSTCTLPGRGMDTGELRCLLGPTGMKLLLTEGWAGTSGLSGLLGGAGGFFLLKRERDPRKESD